jgi:hypothetical protein
MKSVINVTKTYQLCSFHLHSAFFGAQYEILAHHSGYSYFAPSVSIFFNKVKHYETHQRRDILHSLHVGWRNVFSICAVVSVLVFGSGRK